MHVYVKANPKQHTYKTHIKHLKYEKEKIIWYCRKLLEVCRTMDDLQDAIRCHLCETPLPSKHYDICHVHLCEACVEDHLSEESTEHKVVPFALRGSIPKCSTHFTKINEQHCEECNIPICAFCALSGKHDQHNVTDILKIMANKKELMQKDLHELEQ